MNKNNNIKGASCFIFLLWVFSLFPIALTSQNWSWANGVHTNSVEFATDIDTDPLSGNVVTVGTYTGNLLVAPYPGLSVVGGGFVAKYDPNGNLLWAFGIGNNADDGCNGVTVSAAGNIYVTGYFQNTADFKGTSLISTILTASGGKDIFVAKYNSLGQLVWVRKAGGFSDDEGFAVTTNTNNIFVTGYFTNSGSFPGGSSTVPTGSNFPNENMFIACYDPNGNIMWESDAGSGQACFGRDIAADNNGVYVTGDFKNSSLDLYDNVGGYFGSVTNVNSSTEDIFNMALNLTGGFQWANGIHSLNSDFGRGITIGTSQLLITGSTSQNASFPGYASNPVATSAAGLDMYVATLNRITGSTSWVSSEQGPDNEEGISISQDTMNSFCVTGYFKSSISFNGGPTINSTGNEDVFVANYSASSVYWVKQAGANGKDIARGIATNSAGDIYIAGEYENNAAFDSNILTPDSPPNIFVAKIGCSALANDTILSGPQTICSTQTPTTLNGSSPTGGTLPYTYLWQQSPDNSLWSAASGTNNAQNYSPPALSANTYYRRLVSSTGNCAGSLTSASILITVDQVPTAANAGTDQLICGNTTTLTANNPTVGTGTWSLITGTGTITTVSSPSTSLSSLGAGINNFVWSISNGVCPVSIDTVQIKVNPTPTVTANTTSTVICNGQSVTLTGGGASTYTWSGGVTDGVAFSPPSTQTYTVTGTDINGCSNTATTTVNVNSLPAVTANATSIAICNGGTVTLTGGGASTYTWTGGVTDGVAFTPSTTQTYTVTGTDANGCTNSATKTITVNSPPTVTANATATVICSGQSVTLTGGGANTYTWTGGVSNGVAFIPPSTQTYTVTGTDLNGCVNSAIKTIIVNSLPNVTANATATVICNGANVTLTGGGANTYTWTGGITNGIAFTPSSTQTYTVTGADLNGCTNSDIKTITVNALPNVTANATSTVVCSGSSITLTGGGANTYTWTGGITNGIAFTPSGTQTYTVTGTDVNGCVNSATKTITVNPTPTITTTASSTLVCSGNPVTLTASGASTYTWSNGVTNGVSFNPVSTQVYTVTGASNGCTSTVTATITVDSPPTVSNAGSDQIICASSATLAANTPITGTGNWSVVSGGGIITTNNSPTSGVSGLSTGQNIFMWTVSNGVCPSSTSTVSIQVDANPSTANAGNNQNLCTLSTTTLNANNPVIGTGVWSVVSGTATISSMNSANTTVNGLTTGQTIFIWTISNGVCPATTSTVSVQIDAMPTVANAGADISTYAPNATLSANTPTVGTGVWSVTSGSGNFSSNGSPASSVSDLAFGDNIFTWTISNGSCPVSKDEVIVKLHDLVVPNGFSPNGDGVNDDFEIPGLTNYSNVKLEVFNRWGNLVHESSNYKNDWGGKNSSGEDLTDDTYFYTLDIPNKKIFKGYVILKRK